MFHITGGSIGLLAGTINIIRYKGDRIHRLSGMFFFYGMITAGIFALALSIFKTNYFLFIVGVFTLYMVSTGYRYLKLKRLDYQTQKPKAIDWILTITMGIFGIAFIVMGIMNLTDHNNFGIVFLVFGLIGLRMVMQDVTNYQGKSKYMNTWKVTHIIRMIGAYIASVTAFLVVNVPPTMFSKTFSFVPWLLPTVIFTPLIFKWTREFAKRKKENFKLPGN